MTDPKSSSAKPKSRKWLVIIVLANVLAIGGGGFWYKGRTAALKANAAHSLAAERGVVAFDPYVVNLADPAASRFLRVTIQLLVTDAATAERITANKVGVIQ